MRGAVLDDALSGAIESIRQLRAVLSSETRRVMSAGSRGQTVPTSRMTDGVGAHDIDGSSIVQVMNPVRCSGMKRFYLLRTLKCSGKRRFTAFSASGVGNKHPQGEEPGPPPSSPLNANL